MAVNGAPAPDLNAQMLAAQQAAAQSRGGRPYGLSSYDVAFNSLSLTAAAPLGKNVPALMQGVGKQGGLADKFLQAMMAVPEDLKKIAANAGVLYSGTENIGGSPYGNGGSFTSMVSGGGAQRPPGGFDIT